MTVWFEPAPSFWKAALLDFQCFFVTVATVIGTGILGLPVKLSTCGFTPFLLPFIFTLVMQLGVICITAELLQLAKVKLAAGLFRSGRELPAGDTSDPGDTHYDKMDVDADDAVAVVPIGGESGPETAARRAALARASPDLHRLGRMYLGNGARIVFDIAVFFHFIFILISYSLAGSQSFANLVDMSVVGCVTLFVAVFTTVVVVLGQFLQPIIATFTVAKAVIFLSIITVVGVLSGQVNVGPTSSWSSLLQPFLVGTVALGGVVNLMPVLFSKVPFHPSSVKRFRFAVCAGLVTCCFLNVMWAYFVLRLVPQTDADAAAKTDDALAGLDVSLEQAARLGQISTVPVVKIIRHHFQQYDWVGDVVTVFILLSIAISYVTISLGMKHTLDGVVQYWQSEQAGHEKSSPTKEYEFGPVQASVRRYSTGVSGRDGVPPPHTGNAWSQYALDALDVQEGGSGRVSRVDPFSLDDDEPDATLSPDDTGIRTGTSGTPMLPKSGEIKDEASETNLLSPSRASSNSNHSASSQARQRSWPTLHAGAHPVVTASTRLAVDTRPPSGFAKFKRSVAFQRGMLYTVAFGVVYLVAVLNPSSFLIILEVFTSLGLNLEAGVFIAWMYFLAKRRGNKSTASHGGAVLLPSTPQRPANVPLSPVDADDGEVGLAAIPAPMSPFVAQFLLVFVTITFIGAALYDVVHSGYKYTGGRGTTIILLSTTLGFLHYMIIPAVMPREVTRFLNHHRDVLARCNWFLLEFGLSLPFFVTLFGCVAGALYALDPSPSRFVMPVIGTSLATLLLEVTYMWRVLAPRPSRAVYLAWVLLLCIAVPLSIIGGIAFSTTRRAVALIFNSLQALSLLCEIGVLLKRGKLLHPT